VAGPHCPACGAPAEPEARFCRECGAPFGPPLPQPGDGVPLTSDGFAVSDAISYGWRQTRANLPLLVGVSLLYLVISLGLRFGLRDVGEGAMAGFLRGVLSLAVDGVLSVGLITICLKLHDSQPTGFRDLVPRSDLVVRYLFVSAVVTVIVLGGLVLLIVPGIILGLTFMFASFMVIDRGSGLREALRGSARITSGVKWKLFSLGLVWVGLLLPGIVLLSTGLVLLDLHAVWTMLVLVGLVCLLLAFPVVQMSTVFAYRRLLARGVGTPALS
jgi:hypothetical protein